MFKLTTICLFILSLNTAKAQHIQLKNNIEQIAASAKGLTGVAVLKLEDRDTLTYHGNARLVMQSVMKFPIAMAVLHLVDSGALTLDQTIHIEKRDLPVMSVSPLRDKYPKGDVDVSVRELLSDMVSFSDNNACDILLKKLGGPQTVDKYLRSIKIRGINIEATEAEQNTPGAWEVQYTNWCKPADMVKLLDVFYTGNALSAASKDFLYKTMTETTTGPNRIKGLLPPGTVVAHKTGSSGTNDAGLAPATNDIGIITLPNGKHLAIAIFVCNSTAGDTDRDAVIAKIAKAVYDDTVTR
jgi:beta-lactamase class A